MSDRIVRDSLVGAAGIAVGLSAVEGRAAKDKPEVDTKKILNYNADMEYRRLGKTGLSVSAVAMGGHWKRVDTILSATGKSFEQNCHEIVSRCIDVGINYIDACNGAEVEAYSKALAGRRDKMYLGLSYFAREARQKEFRSKRKLLESLDMLLKKSNQEYTDLWRITCLELGGDHTFNTCCALVEALEKAKKDGKARFVGISSHDRRWLKFMIEYFPQLEVVLFPYTAKTKKVRKDSLFDAIKKCGVGAFGIKPFSNNSIFKGSSAPYDPDAEEDDQRARLAIRHILHNPLIIPIPGLVSPHQVDNVVKAVKEGRELDLAETKKLARAMDQAWAKLPENYQWLKDWECV
ncbi:MAG: aldo/keto reductase [Planctomycetota bacterium]|jgi:predicted aldo/keto reductase-like oxidoreductase